MRNYKTVTVPATTKQALDNLTCDLCGKASKHPNNWAIDRGDVAETEVRIKSGTAWPEGGSGTETEFDICPDCFLGKLIPWLESQGAKTVETEWEY